MSPHYWQDPPKPQVVPKSNWFLPPAKREDISTPNSPLQAPAKKALLQDGQTQSSDFGK